MVELGEHCHTHIIPRLKKVIDGEDRVASPRPRAGKAGEDSATITWLRRCLRRKFGNYVISKQYNAAMLAEAMCKQMGFTYAPSETLYWQHGHSTEQDFIYVTTQTLSREQLQKLSDEVGPKGPCWSVAAFRCKPDAFPNLTVTKIPQTVLIAANGEGRLQPQRR